MATTLYNFFVARGALTFSIRRGRACRCKFFYFIPLFPDLFYLTHDSIGLGLDFRIIWVAGRVWIGFQDTNPYGPALLQTTSEIFGTTYYPHVWQYPPNWYPLASFFGLIPFGASLITWNLLNLSLLIVATHLVAQSVSGASGGRWYLSKIFPNGNVIYVSALWKLSATLFFIYRANFYFGLFRYIGNNIRVI